jgi:polyhydroxybutyrate depolymerase
MSARILPIVFMLIVLACHAASARENCGRTGPQCQVPLGEYRIALPDAPPPASGYPALMFYHGAGGSSERTLGNTGMVDAFLAAGYAVIAADGTERPGRFGRGWSFHPQRQQIRDELAYSREVIGDAVARFGIDRDRILLSGFSIGGSLTWYLACKEPGLASAYAPVAGAFWRPHPEMGSCAGPVRFLHTHGWRDETVPLEGRPLRGGAILQGDVFHGLEILRNANGCNGLRADEYDTDGTFWRRWWTRCTPGSALEFALHAGGHSVPAGWAELAIGWFERTMKTVGKQ